MHALLFPPLICPQCSTSIPHHLPPRVKGLALLDAANLEEKEEELVMGTTGENDGAEAPTYEEVRAKLKRLFGKESRRGRRAAHVGLLESGEKAEYLDDDDAEYDAYWEEGPYEEGEEEEECEEEGARILARGPRKRGGSPITNDPHATGTTFT